MVLKKTVFFLLIFAVAVVEINGQNEVTKNDISQHKKEYKKYVFGHQKSINTLPKWVIKAGARAKGYDKFSVKCIPIVYKFYKNKEKELENILNEFCNGDEQDLTYINDALDVYNKKKIRNKNVLTKILHRKHVHSLTLSKDIDKEFLVQRPDEFKKLIDKEEVKTNEYNHAIARNMFLTYLLDE